MKKTHLTIFMLLMLLTVPLLVIGQSYDHDGNMKVNIRQSVTLITQPYGTQTPTATPNPTQVPDMVATVQANQVTQINNQNLQLTPFPPQQVRPQGFGGSVWIDLRIPRIFRTVQASGAGDTAVWTPGAGNRFRLMRFKIQVTGNSTVTVGQVVIIKLRDGTTDINLTHDVFVGTVAGAAYDSGWIDLGNGYLSTTINNVLNVNLSVAFNSGDVRVLVAGTEE